MKTHKYRGHVIVPKSDFGAHGFLIKGKTVKKGWVITDGICNVAPGATWFQTVNAAKRATDVLIAIGGECNAGLFWEVMQPNSWKVGKRDGSDNMDCTATHGRYSCVIKAGVVTSVTVKPLYVSALAIDNLRALDIRLPNLKAL